MENPRDRKYDIAKGIGILSVIAGHWFVSGGIYKYIYRNILFSYAFILAIDLILSAIKSLIN